MWVFEISDLFSETENDLNKNKQTTTIPHTHTQKNKTTKTKKQMPETEKKYLSQDQGLITSLVEEEVENIYNINLGQLNGIISNVTKKQSKPLKDKLTNCYCTWT